jgi:hypothetical protein
MQRRHGAVEKMDDLGRRWVRTYLSDQHREFFPQLPFALLGAVDPTGDVWATLRAAPPGFLSSPDPTRLDVALPREPADPADAGMEDGDAIALLGIQLPTRRRNRMNGRIQRTGPDGFTIAIRHAYGNCAQYIQNREPVFVDGAATARFAPVTLDGFDAEAAELINKADTLFVASYHTSEDGQRSVDVSHRGGNPGFARLDDDGWLTIPDFAGNLFFNTFGNFLTNPKAGLIFIDFDTGSVLQMTGQVELIFESEEIARFQGAERLWRFRPHRMIRRRQALPLQTRFMEDGWSPHTLMTGRWEQPQPAADQWRDFRIVKTVDESSVIRSFMLAPVSPGEKIAAHKPGQFLPISVSLPDTQKPLQRQYTLSSWPANEHYRISVKRQGVVSNFLHGLQAGDIVKVRTPGGAFVIDPVERRPAVLLAAGIGVTPLLAMLHSLVTEGSRSGRIRPTWLFYAARTPEERAFDGEIARLVAAGQGAIRYVRWLTDATSATPDDYDHVGQLDVKALSAALPLNDYDFYMCGPAAFTQSLYDGLRDINIADDRIHTEAFGPASLKRRADHRSSNTNAPVPATQPVSVTFQRSDKNAVWNPEAGSLLDLSERHGLAPEFSCRNGTCGTCRTPIIEGKVAYPTPPTATIAANECLICCAVPANAPDGEDNRLVLDL